MEMEFPRQGKLYAVLQFNSTWSAPIHHAKSAKKIQQKEFRAKMENDYPPLKTPVKGNYFKYDSGNWGKETVVDLQAGLEAILRERQPEEPTRPTTPHDDFMMCMQRALHHEHQAKVHSEWSTYWAQKAQEQFPGVNQEQFPSVDQEQFPSVDQEQFPSVDEDEELTPRTSILRFLLYSWIVIEFFRCIFSNVFFCILDSERFNEVNMSIHSKASLFYY